MSCSKPEETDIDTNLFISGVDADTKARFKARCAAEKRTMKEVILQFMEDYSNQK